MSADTRETTRTVLPVLSSPGPFGGMIAFAFEGHEASLRLRPALDDEALPTHAGQRAIDALLAQHGVADRLIVETTVPEDQRERLEWRIPLAVQALMEARMQISGFAERLAPTELITLLHDAKIVKRRTDGHRVRAAMEGGAHVRVDLDGGAVAFELPEAAMIWLRVPATLSSAVWTRAQTAQLSRKRATSGSERLAAIMLRAAVNDGIAILEAFGEIDLDDSVYAAVPAWLPAAANARAEAPGAIVALQGAGPDMLIFADNEDRASRAAVAALQTFQAHAMDVEVHAWSSIPEEA